MAFENADVSSTCFANLAYDPDDEVVIMSFAKSGGAQVYTIEHFPATEWQRWISSGSLGGYFNSYIRGSYNY